MRAAAPLLLLFALTGAGPVCDAVWRDEARGRDLPVRIRMPDGSAQVPVVLFSPGLGGNTAGGTLWGQAWAARGIAVVHLQHPGSDPAVYQGAADAADRRARVRAAASGEQLAARVSDAGFVVDELTKRRSEGPCYLSRLDLKRLGIAGHSMGSWTAQALAGQRYGGGATLRDPRFVAAIGFSPSALTAGDLTASFGGITIPFFSITGTADGLPPARTGQPDNLAQRQATAIAERSGPFNGMPPGGKYLLIFDGAGHMDFAGRIDLVSRKPHIANVTTAATTAFWGAALLGDKADAAWLARDLKAALNPGDRLSVK
jgi:predicted dienelactone hydrolase